MLIRRQRLPRTLLARAARPCAARTVLTVLTVLASAGTALFALVGFWVLLAPAASAGPGESTFAVDSNALRTMHGHLGYRVCPDLTAIATTWAAHMAATATLAHNSTLPAEVTHWSDLGENVGEGSTVALVQGALVASPPHLANLLSSTFTEAGYGTALDAHGTVWVDEVFRAPSDGPCVGGSTPVAPTPVVRVTVSPTVTPPVASARHSAVPTATAGATARANLLRGLGTASRSTTVRSPADLALVARRHLAAALAAALAVTPNASGASDPVGEAFAYFGTVTRVVR